MTEKRSTARDPHDLSNELNALLRRLPEVRTLPSSDPRRIAWLADKERLVDLLESAGRGHYVPLQRLTSPRR